MFRLKEIIRLFLAGISITILLNCAWLCTSTSTPDTTPRGTGGQVPLVFSNITIIVLLISSGKGLRVCKISGKV